MGFQWAELVLEGAPGRMNDIDNDITLNILLKQRCLISTHVGKGERKEEDCTRLYLEDFECWT